jgi:hypothetical protein
MPDADSQGRYGVQCDVDAEGILTYAVNLKPVAMQSPGICTLPHATYVVATSMQPMTMPDTQRVGQSPFIVSPVVQDKSTVSTLPLMLPLDDKACLAEPRLAEEELEKYKARTAAAETILADLEEELLELTSECQHGKEQRQHMMKALEEAIPTSEHYRILRAMSQDHLAVKALWEQRQCELEPTRRTQHDEAMKRIQSNLVDRHAQLRELGNVSSELQRANAGHRALEDRAARLMDQLKQHASVQSLISERQTQAEQLQTAALESWRQLQNKLWEVEELKVQGAALKFHWQAVAGKAGADVIKMPASVSSALAGSMTSPAQQLFLAHVDALSGQSSSSRGQAGPPTAVPPIVPSAMKIPALAGNLASLTATSRIDAAAPSGVSHVHERAAIISSIATPSPSAMLPLASASASVAASVAPAASALSVRTVGSTMVGVTIPSGANCLVAALPTRATALAAGLSTGISCPSPYQTVDLADFALP